MEKDWVIHYKDLCEEILDLSRPVKDTVQGSDPEFPWGPRVVSVSGRTPGELERLGELRRRKKRWRILWRPFRGPRGNLPGR